MHGRNLEPSKEINETTHLVIGAAIEVHRSLGAGYLESIYEAALIQELTDRFVEFRPQYTVPIFYKGKEIGIHRLDFLVNERLVVEIKAVTEILPIHQAQIISYLRATDIPVGLLINFNVQRLRDGGIKRIVYSH
jgi:GxxExxY protein